jgi:sulfite reductase (NADPH) flavoprotein alpha-component
MQKVPFIPDNAPFTAEQKLWLNGYLAGLFTATQATSADLPGRTATLTPVLIMFGSQTGSAQGLAKRIAQQAKECGCFPRLVDAAAHASIDWKNETSLFVVTSTYGDGDMPDNAQDFWNWLQTDAGRALAHLQFSVLALGDRNYAEFCAAGKKLDARLEEIGARRIHPRADCDVDYDAAARAWTQAALVALTGAQSNGPTLSAQSPGRPTSSGAEVGAASEGYSKTNPFPAPLLANRRLTAEGSGKETRHLEFSLEGSGMAYEAGDAFGVYPANCPTLVEELLSALGCDGEEAVPAPSGGEIPLRKALGEFYDIAKPTPELLQCLGEQEPGLRELLVPGREPALKEWLWGREIIDLMQTTPGAGLKPPQFVTLLKKLAPRLYSISSSPKAHCGQVHLTTNVLRYESHGRARKGVCSSFLAERAGHQSLVPGFIQPSPNFRLPASDIPVIMVGPGTGIAPFRSFLHERRATGAPGRNWLFFGEQRAVTDFYYREELTQMLADGHLTKLSTAFSRDQAEKIYVQHRMLEHAVELWAWLGDGAHFCVCGDAARMAKDVDTALKKVAEMTGGLDQEAAEQFMKQLKSDKRYKRDVY